MEELYDVFEVLKDALFNTILEAFLKKCLNNISILYTQKSVHIKSYLYAFHLVYYHLLVASGIEVISYTPRLICGTLFTIKVDISRFISTLNIIEF